MDAENLVNPADPERIHLLNVPLDIVSREHLPYVIGNIIKADKNSHIVLLSLWDFLRARRNNAYRAYVCNADLIIPISKSLVNGARFLTGKGLVRYMPFEFIIRLLSTLEYRELSIYLIGGRKKTLDKAEYNVKHTFPHLRIVGRHTGRFRKHKEPAIIQAIKKAAPSLLLVGKGVHGKELWIQRNQEQFESGIKLWCSDIYDVFANKKHHPSDTAFKYGLEWIGFCFLKPFYIFRFFSYVRYKLLLVLYKLFKKEKKRSSGGKS